MIDPLLVMLALSDWICLKLQILYFSGLIEANTHNYLGQWVFLYFCLSESSQFGLESFINYQTFFKNSWHSASATFTIQYYFESQYSEKDEAVSLQAAHKLRIFQKNCRHSEVDWHSGLLTPRCFSDRSFSFSVF